MPLDQTKRLGHTDLEWFGPLLVEVLQLREGVNHYIESLKLERIDKQGDPEGISVDQAAAGVVQAMTIVAQQGVPVPAMVDLLNQQRYADFMDVLLPGAPQTYRDDVVQSVIVKLRQIGIRTEPVAAAVMQPAESDDDDGDDDGDNADPNADPEADEHDAKPTSPPPRKKPTVARA